MAIVIPWARVLIAGDYLSAVEIPTLNDGGDVDSYLATLARLRPLLAAGRACRARPRPRARRRRCDAELLDEDVSYIRSLRDRPQETDLPSGRRSKQQRALHAANLAAL